MFVSVFDIFKISVGPSSSHTMGPMLAANAFVSLLKANGPGENAKTGHLRCTLHGSLAFTGEGHGTYRAICCGFLGIKPENYDAVQANDLLDELTSTKSVDLDKGWQVGADMAHLIVSDRKTRLPLHPNGMVFDLLDEGGEKLFSQTYYSVGGGFVLTAKEMTEGSQETFAPDVPHPFANAAQMLEMGEASGLTIAQMKRANECYGRDESEVDARLLSVWDVMNNCIKRGLSQSGELPGGLHVPRRAQGVAKRLGGIEGSNSAPLHQAVDWLSAYAMAVNEENAAGGQVVTAPTNGAAGVIPAVIKYYLNHVPGADRDRVPEMLLTAAAIGGLIKYNASISGAEVGCQGEVGSAAAMAAAALCAVLGGTNSQIENAAEIALEHHLGMTCDPVNGLVQVPCIERNGMGAVKAVAAASLALAGDGEHIVPLDTCIETMRQTGRDMDERYKETSLGGLSVSMPEC